MMLHSILKKSRANAHRYFTTQQRLGNRSAIYKSSKSILRTTKFSIDYLQAFKILDHIDFIYDDINRHWAETDGISITLNTFKDFSEKLLTDTLVHEALHGVILRDSRHMIYEEKEHRIMVLINPDLI